MHCKRIYWANLFFLTEFSLQKWGNHDRSIERDKYTDILYYSVVKQLCIEFH